MDASTETLPASKSVSVLLGLERISVHSLTPEMWIEILTHVRAQIDLSTAPGFRPLEDWAEIRQALPDREKARLSGGLGWKTHLAALVGAEVGQGRFVHLATTRDDRLFRLRASWDCGEIRGLRGELIEREELLSLLQTRPPFGSFLLCGYATLAARARSQQQSRLQRAEAAASCVEGVYRRLIDDQLEEAVKRYRAQF